MKNNKKIKILDLFAGGQSVKKALKNENIEYKGIDILAPSLNDNIIFDLSQDNIVEKLKKELNGWIPDYIWCSPPCNKLSQAVAAPNGNGYFILDKETETISPRKKEDYIFVKVNRWFLHPEKWQQKVNEANLTLKIYDNLQKILDHYKKPYFIENPTFALSRYLLKNHKRQYTNYCMYNPTFSKKSTTIYYGNMELEDKQLLKLCHHIGKHKISFEKNIKNYWQRCRVPVELIQQLFKLKGVRNE